MKEFYNYASKELNIDIPPRVFLKKDKNNASDLLGKTGGYDPERQEIHLYITDRHAKDIIRSFSHELVHHAQKLKGFDEKIDLSKIASDESYSLHDNGLREMERDAFERGNMIFRDWTDTKKIERKNLMAEKKVNSKETAEDRIAALRQMSDPLGNASNTAPVKKKKDNKIKKAKKSIKQEATEQAAHDMKARHGKDMSEQEHVEKLQEGKEEEEKIVHPYPQLFTEKDRVCKELFNKKEELVYQELMRRFVK
jgi:hypothetical protein